MQQVCRINFRTAYVDEDSSLISSHGAIAAHYLRTWFPFDFVSIFPFDVALASPKFGVFNLFKSTRLIKVRRHLLSLFNQQTWVFSRRLQCTGQSCQGIWMVCPCYREVLPVVHTNARAPVRTDDRARSDTCSKCACHTVGKSFAVPQDHEDAEASATATYLQYTSCRCWQSLHLHDHANLWHSDGVPFDEV